MTTKELILSLDRKGLPDSVGSKALNLHTLSALGLRIPKTFAVPWSAFQQYSQDDVNLVDELMLALTQSLDLETEYAVRSSANIEDNLERSFAGQFKSVLNLRGMEDIFQAIWAVWGTAESPRVHSYLEKHGVDAQELLMGVIIQEMVEPIFAGVALSRNPVTGADEVVVEAVKGSGEAVVQAGITPNRWINKWGTWIGEPESTEIPLSLIGEVVEETRRIASATDSYVDLEWVYDGTDLYWLQVREITTINRHNVYSNHIAKEVIPGMIKPLIGSINIPMFTSIWVQVINEVLGRTGIDPGDLAKSFYYRVYFNMGTMGQVFREVGMPADSFEILMGLVPDDADKPGMKPTLKTFMRLPGMLRFAVEKWFFANEMRDALPKLQTRFEQFDYSQAEKLSEEDLLMEIDRLFETVQSAAYYNILGQLLPLIYTRVLKSQLGKLGVDLLQFDLMEGVTELLEYEPNYYLHSLHEEFCSLDEADQKTIRTGKYDDFIQLPGISEFKKSMIAFMERFGHLSDNGNDFSFTPWRETPNLVLDMVVNFLPIVEDGREKIRFGELKVRGLKRWFVGIFYRRTRDFCLMREQISSSYTYGYGLFRYYYQALGALLVRKNIIKDTSDIFCLEDAEIRQLLRDEEPALDTQQIVARHKVDIERFTEIILPSVIYGDEMPPIADPSLDKLVGVPTSIGHYTGKVTVVRGIMDFNKVKHGDVLVIPYSEVSWTPLFARAGGVVAESGGLLSHSSIVAREYNIPAVVSVDGAMGLRDETLVTVNGHTGEIIIHDDDQRSLDH